MSTKIIPVDQIAACILLLRGQKVILDRDLALLYDVQTRALNQAVKRNSSRFPKDFVFALSREEIARISQTVTSSASGQRSRSQTVTLKRGQNLKYRPYAFTEQGVAMLSSVLKSDRAVKVNIAIMRAFVQLRGVLENNRELARRFAELEKHVGVHDKQIAGIIDVIRQLMAPPAKSAREIGFHVRETAPKYRAGQTR